MALRRLFSSRVSRTIAVDRSGLFPVSPLTSAQELDQAAIQSKLRTIETLAPTAGEDTPLGSMIRSSILGRGPMSVADYMQLCLGHPQFGYYMRGDVFGRGGDFTTSPEVSQLFGELVGIWCVLAVQDMGDEFCLVEGGPGRGTLTQAVLKVLSRFPSVHPRLRSVHLVETSPALRLVPA